MEKNTALPTPTTKTLIQVLLSTINNIDNSLPIARYMHAGTIAMGALKMHQPGSRAAANGKSAQAAAIGQRLIARG